MNCEIITDLLPLYADELCSAASRQAVEQHLRECEACRNAFERTQAVPIPHMEADLPTEDMAVKKSFRKIRIRWWASILLVAITLPLLFLGWNEYHKQGIHYSNIYEYRMGTEFMSLLAEGNYEEAYDYIDIESLKEAWLQEWFNEETLANIEADGLAKFCEYGTKLEAAGGIDSYEYIGISLIHTDADGTHEYRLIFKAEICGKTQVIHVDVTNEGIDRFGGGGSFLDDPLAQFSIWTEYLWQDYEGCYFDPETKSYVYYDREP